MYFGHSPIQHGNFPCGHRRHAGNGHGDAASDGDAKRRAGGWPAGRWRRRLVRRGGVGDGDAGDAGDDGDAGDAGDAG